MFSDTDFYIKFTETLLIENCFYINQKIYKSFLINFQLSKYEKIGDTMSLDEKKEKLSVKIDERKVKIEEKKAQAKINHEERKLALKERYTDKKISAHIEKAIKKVYKAEDDADNDILKLLDAIDSEIENTEKPIEFILFKAENKLEEIFLNTQLKMQKAKNELIKNLEKDMEKVGELISLEEDLSTFKDEMDEVATLLDERIEIEKETLALND